ncbi:hypothetical protein [Streptomyces jumonjinensis]|uniref:Lytic transglycosylase domain-containing protein n=1 Tax=Streptomyces jumonjinensis TaxID=1945 RepID=A0A646K9P9_STRJU|nr:hypothetical protein [Streptomyces jumonjinensis]MQS98837.1 hypothetical protein [Streptomyces jumonjinensis]
MKAQRPGLTAAVALIVAGATLTMGTLSTAQAAEPRAAAPSPAAVSLLSDPTPEEQERLREIAGAIWTPQLAAGWNMNAEVADVLSQATERILACSEAFALVPRPPAFIPGLGYLVQYWKNLRDYYLVVKENRTYRACVVSTAAYYRSIIEMASAGI